MRRLASAAATVVLLASVPAAAQQVQPFDACQVFTQADAEAALGGPAQPPVDNPKVKRPKVVPACTYSGTREGKPVAASAHFRIGKSDAETERAFEDNRLQFQTKPLIIRGADAAFWSARTGEMNVRKGRTWVAVAVGPQKPAERDMEAARKAAEALVKKL
jgi:hypothetical protein